MNTEAQIVESWINGNRNWVRSKLKRKAKKKAVLDYARQYMRPKDLDDFINNAIFG